MPDGVKPFVDQCNEFDKGIFVLVKTSNPSSGEFQDRLIDGRPLYELVADKVKEWGELSMDGEYSNVGAVVGMQLSHYQTIFFETGLSYIEKGGKSKKGGEKFSIGLNYLEVPLLLKYSAYVAPATAVEPFIGGYLGVGVSGKVKDYDRRDAYSSFDDGYGANFKRFDGGIRVGCGLAYEMLYAEIGYDFGLSNIGDNAFDDTHNGAFFANIGINF